ncbi:class I SAM-dependent methyltransferase, partial [bacterium]|nr:class I SAM-dependent methyltransferase [bacterium]
MRLSPFIYHKIVRPKFAIKKYILNVIKEEFDFENKKVLDFGCGTGSNSFIFDSSHYLGVDINKERIAYAQKLFP